MIHPAQIRAARAWLRLDQAELAKRADVPVTTVHRLESEEGADAVTPEALQRIQRALEGAGIEFTDDGLRRPRRRTPEEIERIAREAMAIGARVAALPVIDPDFDQDDLYDENGLPA